VNSVTSVTAEATSDYCDRNPLVDPRSTTPWVEKLRQPVAVTGGTGFVGSHLVDVLCAAGIRPRVLVRDPAQPRWIADRPVDWVEGALDDTESLRRLTAHAGTVVHLAGVVRAGTSEAFDRGNRMGTRNVVEAVRSQAPGARLVHVSSLAAAGPAPTAQGIGPEEPARPVSAYGRSKLAAEQEVQSLADDRDWLILRPPAIYGPRDIDVLQFFRMASIGLMARPAGERFITVAFVADVVQGVLAAMAGGVQRRVLHLGERAPRRLDDMMRILAEAGDVHARQIAVPGVVLNVAGMAGSFLQRLGAHRLAMTRDKARELLARHWSARTVDSLDILGLPEETSLQAGARATWAWYRARGWLR